MLSSAIRILDLDGSVTSQHRIKAAASHIVELRALGEHLRFMATRSHMRQLGAALDPLQRGCLTFTGSGDYHHVSAELIGQWQTPLSVIVFDTHPDWDITSPWRCCGSWVNTVLAMPNVLRVIVIGLGRPDLHGWHLLRGNQGALRSGRLELYPASWPHSKTIGRRGIRAVGWQTVQKTGLTTLVDSIITRLPTREVYISIDKDCLQATDALTNWEEGELRLEELASAVRRLSAGLQIAGADITGEYSRGAIRNPCFRLISHLNHPHSNPASPSDIKQGVAGNEETNLALLRAFQIL